MRGIEYPRATMFCQVLLNTLIINVWWDLKFFACTDEICPTSWMNFFYWTSEGREVPKGIDKTGGELLQCGLPWRWDKWRSPPIFSNVPDLLLSDMHGWTMGQTHLDLFWWMEDLYTSHLLEEKPSSEFGGGLEAFDKWHNDIGYYSQVSCPNDPETGCTDSSFSE